MSTNEQAQLNRFFKITVGEQDAAGDWKTAGSLTISEAFDVYRKGYVARLTEALGETYETLWKFLGDDGFFQLAEKYIKENPSQDPNLSNYGIQFPKFISRQSDLAEYGYLKELAFLDWTRAWLFHQKTEKGLRQNDLAQSLNEKSKVQLVNSFLWLKSAFPLFSLWKAIHQELDPPDFSKNENVLLYKKDDQVYLIAATNGQIAILENLRSGKSLEEAIEAGEEQDILRLIELLKENYLIADLRNF